MFLSSLSAESARVNARPLRRRGDGQRENRIPLYEKVLKFRTSVKAISASEAGRARLKNKIPAPKEWEKTGESVKRGAEKAALPNR